MEYDKVIKKQRMTRRFDGKPVPKEVLDKILASAQKAPSAGFSQGFAMLVLEGEETDVFWKFTDPESRHPPESKAPVIIIPLASKQAYLDRYSQPDKAGTGMHVEEGWPVPYWLVDCSFASMIILLSATEAGLGCWFFGIFRGKDELMAERGVPKEFEPIGVIALGYPAAKDIRSPSLKRGRKAFDEFVHRSRW
jgi:nitroreductase